MRVSLDKAFNASQALQSLSAKEIHVAPAEKRAVRVYGRLIPQTLYYYFVEIFYPRPPMPEFLDFSNVNFQNARPAQRHHGRP